MVKENNVRRDLFTYKQYKKENLVRVCLVNDNFIIDDKNKIKQRGIYFNLENYKKNRLVKCKQRIVKAFKKRISDKQIAHLESELEKWMKDKS